LTSSYTYDDGGYAGLQSYGSGGSQAGAAAGVPAPTQGYQQQGGYDQSGYSRVEYEREGYGSQAGVGEGRGYEHEGGAAYSNASNTSYDDGGYGEVYAYDGGQAGEPYGARGTGGSAWNSGSVVESGGSFGGSGGAKVARAVPKADSDSTGGGIQKYRVKMLPDASSSSSKDVIFQVRIAA